jgi:hypothetical protein
MRVTTVEYDALRELAYQDPVCVAQFFHVPEVAVGAEWPFSVDFATEEPSGYTRPLLLCMGLPTGNTQAIDCLNGRSSIGTFSIPAVDVDGEVLRYLSNPKRIVGARLLADEREWVYAAGDIAGYPSRGTLFVSRDGGITGERIRYVARDPLLGRFTIARNGRGVDGTEISTWETGSILNNGEQLRAGQRVQLYAGYRGLTLDKFMPLAKMELRNVTADGPAAFALHVADIQRTMRQLVFNGASRGERVTLLGNPITLLLRLLLSTGAASSPAGTVQVTTKDAVTQSGFSSLSGPKKQIVLGVGTDFTVLRPGDWVAIDFNLTTEQVFQVDRIESATELFSRTILTLTAAGRGWRRAGPAGQYDMLALAAVGYHVGAGTVAVVHPGLVIGDGTAFTKFLKVGDVVKINPNQGTEQVAIVQAVRNDSEFIPFVALTTNLAKQPYWKQVPGTSRADGLALPAIFVDVDGLEALRDREFPDDIFSFSIGDPVTAKDFIEVELLRPLNCYPFITSAGQYGAKRYKVIPPTAALRITEDHIVAFDWDSGMTQIINSVEFEYDWDLPEAPNDFSHKNRLTDTISKRDYGLRTPVLIQAKGISTANDAGRILSDRALQLLTRFSTPRPVHRLAVPYSRHVIEPGDIVSIRHPDFVNLDEGQRGVDEVLGEVTDVAWAFGSVTLTVLDVGPLLSGEAGIA